LGNPIKISRKKLDVGGSFGGFFHQHMVRTNFEWLQIDIKHFDQLAALPFYHADPFDRLLVCQCLAEDLPIVSADPQFDAYGVERLW